MQAKGQWDVISDAKPIDDYLHNPEYPDSLKTQILLIQHIREFAFDTLGLDRTDAYTTLYDQKGKPLLWIITACPAYKLEPYRWEFPIAGKFPYKGFFNLDLAKKEAKVLKEQGYDVRVGNINAWSTLGVLDDPILSNMLARKEGELAELIIHELTHGTLY